ncbi:nucleoside/nucleotide kinase family protein [Jeotgalibacillus aurantiacus]|uniref:hypothetical protein n=1 Tax=Jeotgalibacillus aurantiacus TaxID=2763266 RepID=UPI001D09F29E|nr:hypothetical protein [Jeotgalibacillus aurantiacus]
MTKIISIAAVSGGGKTTLTQRLLHALPHSEAIHFDDIDFEQAPEDLTKWVDDGADPLAWDVSPLSDQIEQVIAGDHPPSYLILDYPFSYLHPDISARIDISIYVHTPLDVAMARRIIRDQREKKDIVEELAHYLSDSRRAYVYMEEQVIPTADLVLDGTEDPALLVSSVLRHLYYGSAVTK